MKQKEIIEAMVQGINRFLFYSWCYESVMYDGVNSSGSNVRYYVPRVIIEAKWSCSTSYMAGKWIDIEKLSNPYDAMPRFYATLSVDNRRALLTWIINNYKDEQKI